MLRSKVPLQLALGGEGLFALRTAQLFFWLLLFGRQRGVQSGHAALDAVRASSAEALVAHTVASWIRLGVDLQHYKMMTVQ